MISDFIPKYIARIRDEWKYINWQFTGRIQYAKTTYGTEILLEIEYDERIRNTKKYFFSNITYSNVKATEWLYEDYFDFIEIPQITEVSCYELKTT